MNRTLPFRAPVPVRLCRFRMDDEVLLGLFRDEFIIPIEAACQSMEEDTGEDLGLAPGENPLDLLGPGGTPIPAVRALSRWLSAADGETVTRLAVPVAEVRMLVPVASPRKILLLAGNYAKHVEERGGIAAERAETFPYIFSKPPSTTLTNPGDPIVIPSVSPDHVDWECELGVVIGRECRSVGEDEALGYVAGYTVVNDVSNRKFAPNPGRKPRERDKFFDWLHGKWHDTFCPVGPCLLAAGGVDPQSLRIALRVNGDLKQDAPTSQMVFPVAAVVAFLSTFVTLEPGDLIATGTPSGVGSATGTYLKDGDVVEASIDAIGTLRNPVEGPRRLDPWH